MKISKVNVDFENLPGHVSECVRKKSGPTICVTGNSAVYARQGPPNGQHKQWESGLGGGVVGLVNNFRHSNKIDYSVCLNIYLHMISNMEKQNTSM